jgi:hypothetical protein
MAERAGKRVRRSEPALDPRRILNEWTRLSRAHLPVHGGCSCGAGSGHIRIADFEQDILDYLTAKYAEARNEEALVLLRGGDGGMEALLRRIGDRAPSSAAQSVLADVARSVESFARLHRGL